MEKTHGSRSVMPGGASYYDAAGDNGYGMEGGEKAFSSGSPAYPSAPNKPVINPSGMDNFRDSRFSGDGGTPSPLGPEPSGKSAIKIGTEGI